MSLDTTPAKKWMLASSGAVALPHASGVSTAIVQRPAHGLNHAEDSTTIISAGIRREFVPKNPGKLAIMVDADRTVADAIHLADLERVPHDSPLATSVFYKDIIRVLPVFHHHVSESLGQDNCDCEALARLLEEQIPGPWTVSNDIWPPLLPNVPTQYDQHDDGRPMGYFVPTARCYHEGLQGRLELVKLPLNADLRYLELSSTQDPSDLTKPIVNYMPKHWQEYTIEMANQQQFNAKEQYVAFLIVKDVHRFVDGLHKTKLAGEGMADRAPAQVTASGEDNHRNFLLRLCSDDSRPSYLMALSKAMDPDEKVFSCDNIVLFKSETEQEGPEGAPQPVLKGRRVTRNSLLNSSESPEQACKKGVVLCITSDRSRWLQPVFEVVDAERSKAFILQVNMRCLHLYGDGLTETSMFLQVLHEAIKAAGLPKAVNVWQTADVRTLQQRQLEPLGFSELIECAKDTVAAAFPAAAETLAAAAESPSPAAGSLAAAAESPAAAGASLQASHDSERLLSPGESSQGPDVSGGPRQEASHDSEYLWELPSMSEAAETPTEPQGAADEADDMLISPDQQQQQQSLAQQQPRRSVKKTIADKESPSYLTQQPGDKKWSPTVDKQAEATGKDAKRAKGESDGSSGAAGQDCSQVTGNLAGVFAAAATGTASNAQQSVIIGGNPLLGVGAGSSSSSLKGSSSSQDAAMPAGIISGNPAPGLGAGSSSLAGSSSAHMAPLPAPTPKQNDPDGVTTAIDNLQPAQPTVRQALVGEFDWLEKNLEGQYAFKCFKTGEQPLDYKNMISIHPSKTGYTFVAFADSIMKVEKHVGNLSGEALFKKVRGLEVVMTEKKQDKFIRAWSSHKQQGKLQLMGISKTYAVADVILPSGASSTLQCDSKHKAADIKQPAAEPRSRFWEEFNLSSRQTALENKVMAYVVWELRNRGYDGIVNDWPLMLFQLQPETPAATNTSSTFKGKLGSMQVAMGGVGLGAGAQQEEEEEEQGQDEQH